MNKDAHVTLAHLPTLSLGNIRKVLARIGSAVVRGEIDPRNAAAIVSGCRAAIRNLDAQAALTASMIGLAREGVRTVK